MEPQRTLRRAELGAAAGGADASAGGGGARSTAAANPSDDRIQISIVQFDRFGQEGQLLAGLFIQTETGHHPFGPGVFQHGTFLSLKVNLQEPHYKTFFAMATVRRGRPESPLNRREPLTRLGSRFRLHLVAHQRRVIAAPGEQILVTPLLDDCSLIKHEDQVGITNGAQPVRGDDTRTGETTEILLNLFLSDHIEMAGCLNEQEDDRGVG